LGNLDYMVSVLPYLRQHIMISGVVRGASPSEAVILNNSTFNTTVPGSLHFHVNDYLALLIHC